VVVAGARWRNAVGVVSTPPASVHSDAVSDRKMTIDELARESGATTRTIRSYQDRQLLPPPEIQGRTGYYGGDHLARLQVIGRLLEQRFSLASISALFEAWETGQSLSQLLGFVEELTRPFAEETPQEVTGDAIDAIFPEGPPNSKKRAVGMGILREIGDDTFEVLSPKLLDTGAKLVTAGVPVERMIEEGEQLRDDCDRIAARFVDMFVTYIWEPFSEAGRPAKDLDRILDYLEVTRPLPVQATSAMISQSMKRQLEKALADLLIDERGEPIELT
jgi:DNA-binding transcriptional MerR regulator